MLCPSALEHLSPGQAGSLGLGVHQSQTSPHDDVSPGLLGPVSNQSANHGTIPILSTTSNRTSPGNGSKKYVASIQSLLDLPPGTDVLSRATEEMGIEAMLRSLICKESLGQLGVLTSGTLVQLLGQVSSHIAPATLGHESQGFNRQTTLHLVENFLVHNNVKNPIIDPVELQRDAEELLDSSFRQGGGFCRLGEFGTNLHTDTSWRPTILSSWFLLSAVSPYLSTTMHLTLNPSRP
jgi:hypothetical protein